MTPSGIELATCPVCLNHYAIARPSPNISRVKIKILFQHFGDFSDSIFRVDMNYNTYVIQKTKVIVDVGYLKMKNMEFLCRNKMPTRCNRCFYCRSYFFLNMFRAPLCPSSGDQEYYAVVAACDISCCKNEHKFHKNLTKLFFYIFSARNTTCSNRCIILLSS